MHMPSKHGRYVCSFKKSLNTGHVNRSDNQNQEMEYFTQGKF